MDIGFKEKSISTGSIELAWLSMAASSSDVYNIWVGMGKHRTITFQVMNPVFTSQLRIKLVNNNNLSLLPRQVASLTTFYICFS